MFFFRFVCVHAHVCQPCHVISSCVGPCLTCFRLCVSCVRLALLQVSTASASPPPTLSTGITGAQYCVFFLEIQTQVLIETLCPLNYCLQPWKNVLCRIKKIFFFLRLKFCYFILRSSSPCNFVMLSIFVPSFLVQSSFQSYEIYVCLRELGSDLSCLGSHFYFTFSYSSFKALITNSLIFQTSKLEL